MAISSLWCHKGYWHCSHDSTPTPVHRLDSPPCVYKALQYSSQMLPEAVRGGCSGCSGGQRCLRTYTAEGSRVHFDAPEEAARTIGVPWETDTSGLGAEQQPPLLCSALCLQRVWPPPCQPSEAPPAPELALCVAALKRQLSFDC